MVSKIRYFLCILVFPFLLDRFVKFITSIYYPSNIVMNEGIAFGLLPSYGILIHFIGILTLILLFFKLFSKKQYKYLIFIIIIFSATLSNFWDRVFLGAVIDNFSIFNVSSFNLADVIITINLMILIKFIIEENNGEKKFYS